MLYPQDNECREVRDLSGIWRFRCDFANEGIQAGWQSGPLDGTIPMPVPASYNEITQDVRIRDHVGWVWYETSFIPPVSWLYKRVLVRVGAASHRAVVWVNGEKAGEHDGGFLPFGFDITSCLWFGKENRITICVSNVLDYTTLPPGEVKEPKEIPSPEQYRYQDYSHDFFNYSGLHRPVKLVAVPQVSIDSIRLTTEIAESRGIVNFRIAVAGQVPAGTKFEVQFLDQRGKMIVSGNHAEGSFVVPDAKFWTPSTPALYTLSVRLLDASGKPIDAYRMKTGIRTVKVIGKKFFLNGKPFRFRGCCRHEDADVRGKGYDASFAVKDSNLLKWLNANSFRTSHYPYAEEILDLADEEGFCVIDELPAVGMTLWSESDPIFTRGRIDDRTLAAHCRTVEELISRDAHHPSVVMWSVANEPATYEEAAFPYFKKVIGETRRLDPTRPVTLVECTDPAKTKVPTLLDVVCVNRYFGWYTDSGRLDLIEARLSAELDRWYAAFQKPVFVTEFGADTIAGMHSDPPAMFSEEFQTEFLKKYCAVFDTKDYVIGEHVWVFADFATRQSTMRVMGNRKGIFTRQRQPKAAAFFLRERWGTADPRN